MTTWILEENVFNEDCFNKMIHTFKTYKIPYHIVRITPFIHKIDGNIPKITGPVVLYGSLGIQKTASDHGWTPGVWTSQETFNSIAYKDALGDLALNYDCQKLMMSDLPEFVKTRDIPFFIKPNYDTKEFAGTLIDPKDFISWYTRMIDSGYLENTAFDVIVSEPKKIIREWRIVVVDGVISSSSLYKQYQLVKPKNHCIPEVRELVHHAHEKYKPAPIYVIDVAETPEGFKVVEYNTFNSAGLYDCDVEKIIKDVTEFVDKTYS